MESTPEQLQAERSEELEKLKALYKGLFAKTVKAISSFEPAEVTLDQLTRATRTLTDLARVLYPPIDNAAIESPPISPPAGDAGDPLADLQLFRPSA